MSFLDLVLSSLCSVLTHPSTVSELHNLVDRLAETAGNNQAEIPARRQQIEASQTQPGSNATSQPLRDEASRGQSQAETRLQQSQPPRTQRNRIHESGNDSEGESFYSAQNDINEAAQDESAGFIEDSNCEKGYRILHPKTYKDLGFIDDTMENVNKIRFPDGNIKYKVRGNASQIQSATPFIRSSS